MLTLRMLLLFIIFLLTHPTFAQKGIIQGTVKVLGTQQLIADVDISIVGTDISTVSDDSGRFIFKNINPGVYQLHTFHADYMPLTSDPFSVKNGDQTIVDLYLEKRPSHLDKFMDPKKIKDKRKDQTKEEHFEFRSASKKKNKKPRSPSSSEPEAGISKVRREKPSRPTPSQSGLRAGFADDNQQFNYFLKFLQQYKEQVSIFPLDIQQRLIFRVRDKNNRPLPNAQIKITVGDQVLEEGRTYADGTFYFYPSRFQMETAFIDVNIASSAAVKDTIVRLDGPRKNIIRLPIERKIKKPLPVDILFILDTTGSMGEEIERLKSTIDIIHLNIRELPIDVQPRFGMVLYRDRDDQYVTRLIPLTPDLDTFRKELYTVKAGGGGDTPEDLQSALQAGMQEINWDENGLRLGFIITDAPPHLDYDQPYRYTDAAIDAKQDAIKFFTIGTGGLDLTGEYVLRQIAQFSAGKYIFLTYGEQGESEGGKPGSVSHHTGTNYQTDKLEAIIIRFVKEDIAHLADLSLTSGQDYWQAHKISNEAEQETLNKLFKGAVRQLLDYSSIAIEPATPVSVIPIHPQQSSLKNNAEYFTERLALSLGEIETLQPIERADLQAIAKELGLHLSGLVDDDKAAEAGKFIGAKLLIVGHLYYNKSQYELILKLLRVETAEVLSATRLKIETPLGL
ncbi:MAG: VWA domain-containing protein [Caldithrix sp.]|nr:VWA domain-containing protein [Caldithrix sp.]